MRIRLQKKSKLYADLYQSSDPTFRRGELVVIYKNCRGKDWPKKLLPRAQGPYQILKRVSRTCYSSLLIFSRVELERLACVFSGVRAAAVGPSPPWSRNFPVFGPAVPWCNVLPPPYFRKVATLGSDYPDCHNDFSVDQLDTKYILNPTPIDIISS